MQKLRILIVEDSPQDRQLLRYILESHFGTAATFNEADSLRIAFEYLSKSTHDAIVLDLSLPDSMGRETFTSLNKRFPHIPILVMTHNVDRELALAMIKEGAADYILKDYTKDEDIFRRILFAIEKHRTTVRLQPDNAATVQQLDSIRAKMMTAHESGQHTAVRELSVETTRVAAELTRKTFTTLQDLSFKMERLALNQEHLQETIGEIKAAVFGQGERPSIRSQIDVINVRLGNIEKDVESEAEDRVSVAEVQIALAKSNNEVQKTRLSGRTKVLLALVGVLSTLGGAYIAYKTAQAQPSQPAQPNPAQPNQQGKQPSH